jgi:NAD/NADP transhydrogenase beta subunit
VIAPVTAVAAAETTGHSAAATASGAIATAAYLFACACFILALRWLSAPVHRPPGQHDGPDRHAAAIVGALLSAHVVNYQWIVLGLSSARSSACRWPSSCR